MNEENCPKCGALAEPGHVYCSRCGRKIAAGANPIYSKGGWAVLLLAVVSVLGFTAALVGFYRQGELERIVEDQLKSIRAKKYTEAYYEYTSKEFQDSTSLDAFRSFIKSLPPLSDNKSITFKGRGVEGDAAVVEAVLQANDGEEAEVEYQLAKENGKWKIMGIKAAKRITQEASDKGAK